MGKNQSKERRKSKENTPEPQTSDKDSPASRPSVKRQSTLQALKEKIEHATPSLKKSDSTRSKIRWPSSSRKSSSSAVKSPHALSKDSIAKPKDTAQDFMGEGITTSTNNRNIDSKKSHFDRSIPIERLENCSIASTTEQASQLSQGYSESKRASSPAITANSTHPRTQSPPPMASSQKENMRLSPTTTIQTDTMANSGICSTPTKRIFDAAQKRRAEYERDAAVPVFNAPTSHPAHFNANSVKPSANTVFTHPSGSKDRRKEHREVGIYQSEDEPEIIHPTKPVGRNKPKMEAKAASRKRKSDVVDDGTEGSAVKTKKRLGPEDFEKLAQQGLFSPGSLCNIRQGMPIPYQLLEHIKVYYEEGLCESLHYFLHHVPSCPFLSSPFVPRTQPTNGVVKHATTLLNCICVSGRGHESEDAFPSFIPPPTYIALLSTIMIHPKHTTDCPNQARARDDMMSAYNCLSNVLDAVGPKQANIKVAFQFSRGGERSARNNRNSKRHREGSDSTTDEEGGDTSISTSLANRESVWNTAKDLWHVVGWAFNCSVKHKSRWEYYWHWLRLVTYAIQDDMEDCVNDYESKDFDPVSRGILGRTIIPPDVDSLTRIIDTKPALKRAIAAIFATGDDASLKMFPEVWKDELNPKARAENRQETLPGMDVSDKIDKLLGNYKDGNESKGKAKDAKDTVPDWGKGSLGDEHALEMRCVFITLLLDFDYNLFGRSQASTAIYDIICDNVVNLRVVDFMLFLSHFSVFAPRAAAASLFQVCANRLIDTKAPPNLNADDEYDLPVLVKCYLPWTANTSHPADNTKLACCIDSMVRLYQPEGVEADLGCTRQEVTAAIDTGTYARLSKIEKHAAKKQAAALKAHDVDMDAARHRIRLHGTQMKTHVDSFFKDTPLEEGGRK